MPAYLLQRLLVLVRALEQLVQGHRVLAKLCGVGHIRHMQPVEGHEGDAATPRLVQQPHQLQAGAVIVNHHLAGKQQQRNNMCGRLVQA
jgi:hypothetical protein